MSMSPEALAAFQRFDALTGGAPKVNSAYRDPDHNARVGGAKNSQHTHGNAYDFDVSGMPVDQRIGLIRHAREAGFRGIGVYDNALHFDVGPERAWGPSRSRDSLPEWYLTAFGPNAAPDAAPGPDGAKGGQINRLAQFSQLASMMPRYENRLSIEDFRL